MGRRRWQRPDGSWCFGYRKTDARRPRAAACDLPDFIARLELPALSLFVLGPSGIGSTEVIEHEGRMYVESAGKTRKWVEAQIEKFARRHFQPGRYIGRVRRNGVAQSARIDIEVK